MYTSFIFGITILLFILIWDELRDDGELLEGVLRFSETYDVCIIYIFIAAGRHHPRPRGNNVSTKIYLRIISCTSIINYTETVYIIAIISIPHNTHHFSLQYTQFLIRKLTLLSASITRNDRRAYIVLFDVILICLFVLVFLGMLNYIKANVMVVCYYVVHTESL